MKAPEAVRATLMARLTSTVHTLKHLLYHDSAKAVEEAQEVIRALPFADDINAALYNPRERAAESPLLLGNLTKMRELRQWHYEQYIDFTNRANEMQKRCDRRMLSETRNDFERVANDYRTKANRHLRFVRSLNDFFPAQDKVA
jgi:hypothetical protein